MGIARNDAASDLSSRSGRAGAVFDGVEPERWREAHDEHEDGERRRGRRVRRSEDRRAGFDAASCAFGSVEKTLHEPEHVSRAENDAESRGDGPAAADAGEGAGEDQEFADEAVEHGQADHGERGDDEEGGGLRNFSGQAAIGGDLAGEVAELKRAEEHKERGVDHFVIEDLVDGAVPAGKGEPIDAEDDEAEVAERGEGEQTPEVALHQGEASAVENADDGERDEHGSDVRAPGQGRARRGSAAWNRGRACRPRPWPWRRELH